MEKEINTEVTLYDLNKQMIKENTQKLNADQIADRKEMITNFLKKRNGIYWMLLSNEKKDYTVFRWPDRHSDFSLECLVNILVDECLPNRGEIRSIEKTEQEDAIEIWLIIDDEPYVYFLFCYDFGVVEV